METRVTESRRSPGASALLRRHYGLACGLMVLLGMPARFANLGTSLWLDEAWVANSLLAPTLRETLYFDRWAQSTPPLFLVIARAVLSWAGYSEPALRIVPLLAALLSLLILAVVLRRLFSPPVALLAFAMAMSNYWIIKQGQQVKQYGTDLLAACLILLLLERVLRGGPRFTGAFHLGLLGCALSFLSFTSAFWFASCVAAVSLPSPGPATGALAGRPCYRRAVMLALWLAGSLGLNYLVFVRPNLAPSQVRNFAAEFIDITRPGASLAGLQTSFGALLLPLSLPLARGAVWLIEALMAFGAFRAVRFSLRGDRTALTVLLAGPLPIAAAILASAARLYPILSYPRFLIWSVPCCVVLVGYALTPAVAGVERLSSPLSGRLLRYGTPAACLAVVILSQFMFFASPRPTERNREAAEFIRSKASGSDLVFVHGGMNEQFLYYSRLLSWNPDNVYFGNTNWPCCALNKERRTSSPGVRDLMDDLRLAAARARNHTLWLLLPAGVAGHWSGGLGPLIDAIPPVLGEQGCRQELREPFDQTLALAFSCH